MVKDKRTKKSKGFGFVSFKDSLDFAKALKEMNGEELASMRCVLAMIKVPHSLLRILFMHCALTMHGVLLKLIAIVSIDVPE